MADKVLKTAQNIADGIKGGVHGVHGAGEMIRGGAMEAVDNLFDEPGGEQKNRTIADKGAAEMKRSENQVKGGHSTSSKLNQGSGYSTTHTSGDEAPFSNTKR
ncbi:hypothetical protein B7463_g10900, partial [Scytalidium lignicola]